MPRPARRGSLRTAPSMIAVSSSTTQLSRASCKAAWCRRGPGVRRAHRVRPRIRAAALREFHGLLHAARRAAAKSAHGRTSDASKVSPLGVKGMGESGCTASLPALVNAVIDALRPLGVKHLDMPLTPRICVARDAGGAARKKPACGITGGCAQVLAERAATDN